MTRSRRDRITHHCTVCDWTASTEGKHGRDEVSRLAIEHYCRSGHTIVSDEHDDSPQGSIRPLYRISDRFDGPMPETLL